MDLKYLKPIRIVVSLFFFLVIAVLFLDLSHALPRRIYDVALYLQFMPALLKGGITGFAFFILIILSFGFGRIYCSSICPLGTYQDIISRIGMKFKKKKIYKYSKPQNILRYSITAITFISLAVGFMLFVNLLDPYSMFGKIFYNFFRPLYISINNLLAEIFHSFGSSFFHHADMIEFSVGALLVTSVLFLTVTVMSFFRGRLYCNTICPVGGILSLFAISPLLRLDFKDESCTVCGMCATVCKAECIDIKNRKLDFTRCVSCYNCLKACPENSFEFKSFRDRSDIQQPKPMVDLNKRAILKASGTAAASTVLSTKIVFANNKNEFREREDRKPVLPPGAKSIKHYTENCIACQLCVSACPTGVIQQKFYDLPELGLMQPRMDFFVNYCTYECVRCGKICPTGAISQITKEEKKTVQIGQVELDKNICIVFADETDCGACSEHCPTKAVYMVPWKDLRAPEIDPEICVGCGACEFACPTIPYKAIYVVSNEVHQKAKKPKQEKLEHRHEEDFPF